MPLVLICGEKVVKVLGTQKAPGICPFCSGTVVVTDVETARSFFCLPICLKNKKKFSCETCNKRLVPFA